MRSLFVFAAIPIIETKQAYNITEGDNITCTATGYPEPDIALLNSDGSPVDENRLHHIVAADVGNLVNMSVSMTIESNDAGVYICIANNSIGNDTIKITVNCKLVLIVNILMRFLHVCICSNSYYRHTRN